MDCKIDDKVVFRFHDFEEKVFTGVVKKKSDSIFAGKPGIGIRVVDARSKNGYLYILD